MKTAYIDAFSGISGDMFIGALLDAGLSIAHLRKEIKKLGLDGYSLSATKVKRNSITASSFSVKISKKQKNRDYAQIVRLIKRSALSSGAKKRALNIFELIAKAEAEVHGQSIEKVHFHEVGAVDSIIDVVGAAIGLEKLGIERVVCSPIPLGSGFVKTSHGVMPVPAPATLLILEGVPVRDGAVEMELVTPTGAAVAVFASSSFGGMPAMKVSAVGYGAGDKIRDDGTPNLLRIVIGKAEETGKRLFVIEANIDDSTPERISYAASALMDKGALDSWVSPITMKKGRQAFTLSALCEAGKCEDLRNLIMEETSSIGVRQYEVDRFELLRRTVKVKTEFGDVRLKISAAPSGDLKAKPEFDDLSRLAAKHGVPYKNVLRAAMAAGRKVKKR